jgi:hypothetical protein
LTFLSRKEKEKQPKKNKTINKSKIKAEKQGKT